MNTINPEIQEITIASLESTYNKLTNSYKSMSEKGANTTLVQKRQNAVKIGLQSLKEVWNGDEFNYEVETIVVAKEVLQSVLPSIEKQIAKAKEGSPQKTLNERRIIALNLAIESLDERI